MQYIYPTIQELKNTIDVMRKAYPFDDKTSKIYFGEDIVSGGYRELTIHTLDNQSGTKVTLQREYLYEDNKQ